MRGVLKYSLIGCSCNFRYAIGVDNIVYIIGGLLSRYYACLLITKVIPLRMFGF